MEPEQNETKTETQNVGATQPATATAAPVVTAAQVAPAAEEAQVEAPKTPSLVEQIAALIHEDQSASKRPPTLLYKINGALDLAKRILDLMQPATPEAKKD